MQLSTQTAPSIDSAPVRAEFARLALLANKGDADAEEKLIALEAQIADHDRQKRRREAAAEEQQRLSIQAEKDAGVEHEAAQEAELAKLIKAQLAAYKQIEVATEKLVVAIRQGLAQGAEARSMRLRFGRAAGVLPSNEISRYLFWRLGRDGDQMTTVAGLSDMPAVVPQLRQPLVKELP
jgi:hypothetical protein